MLTLENNSKGGAVWKLTNKMLLLVANAVGLVLELNRVNGLPCGGQDGVSSVAEDSPAVAQSGSGARVKNVQNCRRKLLKNGTSYC